MKVRRKKLLALLICAALSVTDILPVGFSVSARELEQENPAVESEEETEDDLQEESVSEGESSTDDTSSSEDAIAEESENAAEIKETENETQKEKSEEEDTEDETWVQQESSEMEEMTESETGSETQEQKTELDSRKETEKGALEGAYQFGDSPADNNRVSTYSVKSAADTNISELEEYLYQQMKAKNEMIDVESYQINTEEIGDIITGVLNENPDLYFVNRSYRFTHYEGDTLTIEVKLTYDNSLNEDAFQKAVRKALSVVKSGMSDLEKAVALHDYLALNCEYDNENYEAGTVPNTSYSAYGILVNRTAVCQGYALAYKYLLNQIGINCYMVISREMNHGWNLIELNGTYYQVDVTWDDPVWDLIGRVRHQYMFRSDNDFENECKHHDWSVTKGSEVVDYKAMDTAYDAAFWLDCDSPLVLADKDCYYVSFNEQKYVGVINKAALSDSAQKGTELCEIGEWTVWGNDSGYYPNAYSGLFQANNRLYFNDKTSIYSIDLNDIGNKADKRTEFTADTTNGYIYGSAFCQGKVLYSLRQKPSVSSRDTVLTADIEIEEPSEIPVEKIELDKGTLKLAIGGTAKLQAAVTPDNAADADVIWKSSDVSIATVENGTVTAVAAGSCTITAAAGGKEAVCDVTVTAVGEDIASGSYKDITWVIDSERKLTVTGTGDFMENKKSPWYRYRNYVVSAEINVTGAVDTSYMFNDHPNLIHVDMSGFDTSKVTNMCYMFYGCESLENLDLSNFNTDQVTDMNHMFLWCSVLESLDLSSFNTSKVTNMCRMFSECENLTSLDLNSFDTGNVTDMEGMFFECYNLESLNLSSFDTGNVTDMSDMFYSCYSLESLDLSGFDTSNVTDMRGMFGDCGSLESLDIIRFDTSNVTDMSSMFSDCNSLESLDLSGFNTSNVTDMSSMFSDCNSLESLDLSSFDTSKVTDMKYMFHNCTSLTSIDLRGFNVGKVEEMDSIFSGCSKLTTIHTPYNITQSVSLPIADAEVWCKLDGTAIIELPQNLSYSIMLTKKTTVSDDNITSGSYRGITWMIDANGKLTVIGKGEFFDNYTKVPWYAYKDTIISAKINVTDMYDEIDMYGADVSNMFRCYSNLESVDLSGFDIKKVTNMSGMFFGCSSLTSVDLSGFDTRDVTDMSGMFAGCSNLTSVDVSGFDTGNVTNLNTMFSECSSLTSVDVSGFDTGNVTDMSGMFAGCSSLTSIDVKGFDIRNAASMSNMFENCSKLTFLDLSDFDLGNFWIENEEIERAVSGMLDGCVNLATVHTPCSLSQSVSLPKAESGDIWYQFNGTAITELPQNLDYSIIIAKNSIPTISEPYITAKKDQIFYECGDALDFSDLKVMYHNVDGTVQEINDFSTNKDEIDMDTAGVKTLKIIYDNLEATIKLNVKRSIASGSYGGITWVINSKGKLRVEGTGDFAEPTTGDYHGNHSNVDVDRAPWFVYKDSIISAEVNVTGMTDASYMFNECRNLKSIELGGLDTGSITNMIGMFCRCESLEDVNVSKFNTENVTNMGAMFYRCLELKNIDVSGFDTSKVTNMGSMFGECWSLETLDVSGFDTSKVTSMSSMFWSCWELEALDVSGFDTSKVTSMGWMFCGCENITSLDMSGFDFSKVTNSDYMFGSMMWGWCGVTSIYTPCNVVDSVPLPSGNWYQPDGTIITELPKNLPYSILITKNTIPTVSAPHIVANKAKKIYTCGDTLNTNDLTVRFYNTNGTVKTVTNYTTNADTIDMSTVGTKTLVINYNNLTAEIKLTVTATPQEITYTITFDLGGHGTEIAPLTDIAAGSLITEPTPPTAEGYQFMGWYKDSDYSHKWDFNTDTVQENITLYAYWIAAEKTYTVTFDLCGHGTEIAPLTDIIAGSLITEPTPPTAEGYQFMGWYKDQSCTILWNFVADTVQADTILYARWTANGADDNKDKDDDDSPYPDSERTPLSSVSGTIANIKTKVYDGDAYEPVVKVTVTVDGTKVTLTEGADYRVRYEENTKAGTGKVIVSGVGIYIGDIDKTFTISPKPVKKLKIITGSTAGMPELSTLPIYVYDGAKLLTEGTDYTLSNLQGAQVTVTGKGNYNGSVTAKVTVYESGDAGKLINPENVILKDMKDNETPYTGKALKPAVTVTINGKALTNKDYKVQYQNNKNAGTAFVIVTGKGEYKGKAVVPFTIKAETNKLTVNAIPDKTYSGKLQKPAPAVSIQKDGKLKKLAKNKDYTVSYKNNFHVGTAVMYITGKGNYAGLSAEKTFKINPQEIKKAALKGTKDNLTLTYSKRTLREGYDYETPEYGAVNKNKIEVTIKGKGNFTGTVTKSVKTN